MSGPRRPGHARRHVLVVRLDSMGDVIVCGPAIRAVADGADRVSVLTGPHGAAATRLLPGVDDVLGWACPWILGAPPAVEPRDVAGLVDRLRELRLDAAVILTSFHQSALPTALLLRLAGIPHLTAVSTDYPGSLLDVRLAEPGEAPEPVRMLEIVAGAGYALPGGDDGRLAVRRPLLRVDDALDLDGLAWPAAGTHLLVAHPGASAPARAYPPALWTAAIERLVRDGWQVVLTGSPAEMALTAGIVDALGAGSRNAVRDLAGRLDLPHLAAVLECARVTVVANTGPAHLSAAVGTPVVSLFAPVASSTRWAPYGVPVELLGDQWAGCRDTRWTRCRIDGHPCLGSVTAHQIADAVRRLAGSMPSARPQEVSRR